MSEPSLWADYQRKRLAWDFEKRPSDIPAVVAAYEAWVLVSAPAYAAQFTAKLERLLEREAVARWPHLMTVEYDVA